MGPQEMAIPPSRGDRVMLCVWGPMVFVFSALALLNLCRLQAVIASSLWLALVVFWVWEALQETGGWRQSIVGLLSVFGRKFVEVVPAGATEARLRFGFQFLRWRFVQHTIALNKVASVKWSPGQATSLAGRDMKDWSVWLWANLDDPVPSEEWSRKPNQKNYQVGPARPKEEAEAYAMAFMNFLHEAGVTFVRRKEELYHAQLSGE